jgi:hypothetical protein
VLYRVSSLKLVIDEQYNRLLSKFSPFLIRKRVDFQAQVGAGNGCDIESRLFVTKLIELLIIWVLGRVKGCPQIGHIKGECLQSSKQLARFDRLSALCRLSSTVLELNRGKNLQISR